jgi:DNA-binding PadR family transcriptional regulator
MSLDHILLGLLREPRSGYDLKAVFDRTVNHFWPAELSQVYRILKRLESEGKLASRVEPSSKGPDRRVYSLTRMGRRVLRDWLSSKPLVDDERYTYLAQVFFMAELNDLEATTRFIEELRRKRVDQLETLREIERVQLSSVGGSADGLSDDQFHQYLTLRTGINTMTARIAWCDETLKRIRRRSRAKRDNGENTRRRIR